MQCCAIRVLAFNQGSTVALVGPFPLSRLRKGGVSYFRNLSRSGSRRRSPGVLDSNPEHVRNHNSKTAVSLYRQATRASIRNPEGFGWNPEGLGLNSSKIQWSPEIRNPSVKIQRSRRPWSNPKHGGGIQAHALSDPDVGMCDGFESQITGLALNRASDSRSLNPAGNSQLESKCSGIRKKTLDFSNYLKFQRLEIQLDPMIVHECLLAPEGRGRTLADLLRIYC